MQREIALTKGKVTIVDSHNFEWLNQWSWCASLENGIWYAVRERKRLTIHRVIMEKLFPCFKGLVDHKDHDGLNNLENNLRIATRSENGANRRLNCNNTAGFKGVYYSKETKKWRTMIGV